MVKKPTLASCSTSGQQYHVIQKVNLELSMVPYTAFSKSFTKKNSAVIESTSSFISDKKKSELR